MPYATVAQIKEYLDISGNADDGLLGRLRDAAQAAIEAHCNRSFELTTTSKSFGMWRWQKHTLFLGDDLRTLTSVTTSAGDTYAATQFTFSSPARVLYLKVGEPMPNPDASHFTVTGGWGYTTSAPADVVQACIRLAGHYYRLKDAQAYDLSGTTQTGVLQVGKRMPEDVAALLAPYVAREGIW